MVVPHDQEVRACVVHAVVGLDDHSGLSEQQEAQPLLSHALCLLKPDGRCLASQLLVLLAGAIA